MFCVIVLWFCWFCLVYDRCVWFWLGWWDCCFLVCWIDLVGVGYRYCCVFVWWYWLCLVILWYCVDCVWLVVCRVLVCGYCYWLYWICGLVLRVYWYWWVVVIVWGLVCCRLLLGCCFCVGVWFGVCGRGNVYCCIVCVWLCLCFGFVRLWVCCRFVYFYWFWVVLMCIVGV